MNINSMTKNLFIMDHNQDISASEVKARGDQLDQVLKVVHPKRFSKLVPMEYKKDVAAACKAIRKQLLFMKKNSIFLNIEGTQKSLAELAAKFNKVTTEDGKTAILPIGLLALSHIKIKKPHNALSNIKKHTVEQTFSQLHTEYLKQKLKLEEAKAKETKQATTAEIFDEESKASKTEHKKETKSSSKKDGSEGAAVLKSSSSSEEAEQVADKSEPAKADLESVGAKASVGTTSTDSAPEVIETEDTEGAEDVKAAKEREIKEKPEVRKPKRRKPKKSKKKLGFWGSIANFFKNMFLAIFRFFSGKKKNQVQK